MEITVDASQIAPAAPASASVPVQITLTLEQVRDINRRSTLHVSTAARIAKQFTKILGGECRGRRHRIFTELRLRDIRSEILPHLAPPWRIITRVDKLNDKVVTLTMGSEDHDITLHLVQRDWGDTSYLYTNNAHLRLSMPAEEVVRVLCSRDPDVTAAVPLLDLVRGMRGEEEEDSSSSDSSSSGSSSSD
jgi:hypothetical protein